MVDRIVMQQIHGKKTRQTRTVKLHQIRGKSHASKFGEFGGVTFSAISLI